MSTFLRYESRAEQDIKIAEAFSFPNQVFDPQNELVNAICTKNKTKFVDLDFRPSNNSISQDSKNNGVVAELTRDFMKDVTWKRVNEFMKGEYKVFESGIIPNDIRQGSLADCWFLCALAALAEFPALIELLFPKGQGEVSNPNGVYTVKICKNGYWQQVRIDDYFPCKYGKPVFSKNNDNELWVMLIEKAYAKLHGSYDAIKCGWAYEAMIDLTGAPYITIRMDDDEWKPKVASGELWDLLHQYDLENYIMSLSTFGEDIYTEFGNIPDEDTTGLIPGHAYSLISVKTTLKGHRLLKIRNPWGRFEWKGDWSDDSPLWTPALKAEMNHESVDDGTFWMCYEDVAKYFFSVNVCMIRHPGLNKEPWYEARRRFHFELKPNRFIPLDQRLIVNCYDMTVTKPGDFILSVHQEDKRCENAKPYIDIGVSILKANDNTNTSFTLVTGTGNTTERQNQTKQIHLDPGNYIVVPTSTGCKLKQYYDTQLNISMQSMKISSSTIDTIKSSLSLYNTNKAGEIEFTTAVIRVLSEIYAQIDKDNDCQLTKLEIDGYMSKIRKSPISDATYRQYLSQFDNNSSSSSSSLSGLSLAGFIRLKIHLFKQSGCNEKDLLDEFKIYGYDENLLLVSARHVVLAIHGTSEFTLKTTSFNTNAFKAAIELPVLNQGTQTFHASNQLTFYRLRSSYNGMSYVVKNNNKTHKYSFKMDCSASKNVIGLYSSDNNNSSNNSSSNNNNECSGLIHEVIVEPGETKIVQHLMPADPTIGWTWSYNTSHTQL